jgi:UDP-glucose-4-epimerase GalE
MKVLVVGGAGYIGSQVVLDLVRAGHEVVVVDDLSSGLSECVHPRAVFRHCDICVPAQLADVFATESGIEIVVHFAAKISVSESVEKPDEYWRVNLGGTRTLLDAMKTAGVGRLVFSSTAAVYGEPSGNAPLREDTPLSPINPYGETKVACEEAIAAAGAAWGLRAVALRYFNAAGADASLRLGLEKPSYSHLVPLATRAALGQGPALTVCGDDYPTPDGTCIRDYVHVADLSAAHLLAGEYLAGGGSSVTLNLGTKRGSSVREVIAAVDALTPTPLPWSAGSRRAGDPAVLVADATRARQTLGWEARRNLDDIVRSDYDFRAMETPLAQRLWPQ